MSEDQNFNDENFNINDLNFDDSLFDFDTLEYKSKNTSKKLSDYISDTTFDSNFDSYSETDTKTDEAEIENTASDDDTSSIYVAKTNDSHEGPSIQHDINDDSRLPLGRHGIPITIDGMPPRIMDVSTLPEPEFDKTAELPEAEENLEDYESEWWEEESEYLTDEDFLPESESDDENTTEKTLPIAVKIVFGVISAAMAILFYILFFTDVF